MSKATDQANEPGSAAALWTQVFGTLRGRVGRLVAVSVLAKLVLAAAVAPLVALVLHLGLALGGEPVVTDLGVLSIATSPIALAGAVAAAVVLVSGWVFELVAMVAVVRGTEPGVWAPVRGSLARSPTIAWLVARVMIESARWVVPVVVVAGGAYLMLLSEYDINYYLKERPPAFWAALAIAGVAAAYGVWGFARMVTRWLAAPALVADGLTSGPARRAVAERDGRASRVWRVALAQWLAGSLIAPAVAAAIGAGVYALVAPWWPRGLVSVATGLGLYLVGGWAAGLAVNACSTAALAGLANAALPRTHDSASRSDEAADPKRRVTRLRFAAAVVGLLLASALAGFAALARVEVDTDVAVIAHRGAALVAPENTLAAVEAAIGAGADWVEVDVQETADGEVVVVHDSDFMKSAGVAKKVWDVTAAELAEIDIGSRFSPEFADQRTPTLREVLEACRDRAGLLVELKYYGHDVDLERRVVDVVEAAGMADQTRFMSLNREGVRKLKALRPDWSVGQLLSVYLGQASKLEADFLAMNASFVGPRTVRAAERNGRDVYVWTVNDPVQMASLATAGVAGLITDDPTLARSTLQEWRDLSPVGRLLVHLAGAVAPHGGGEQ